MRRTLASAAWLLVLLAATEAASAAPRVSGRVADPQALPLPGVAITLVNRAGGSAASAVTDRDGAFAIDVPPGVYTLRAELSGFEPLVETVDVSVGPRILALTLRLGAYQEQVNVLPGATPSVIGPPVPNAPVALARTVIDNGMLPNNQYDDVLPLLPNVVRGPDGQISVAGSRAPEGALIVDGVGATDPVVGAPALMLPLEAVESVDVFAGGYPADLGLATGGVTAVHTVSGADRFHATATSFFPRLWIVDGQFRGIDSWEPNFGVSGPIRKDRVFFDEAISYRFDRNLFTTLVGPQTNVFDTLQSWSQVDLRATSSEDVRFTAGYDLERTDHWNITAFTPASTVPELRRRNWIASASDRVTSVAGSALEVHASLLHTGATVDGSSSGPYELAHDLTTGNYFNAQDLQGSRVEAGASWTWAPRPSHVVKLGSTIARSGLDGLDRSAPVDLLRSDGTIAQTIAFAGGGTMIASQIETGAFVEDRWTASDTLTIDTGVRLDASSQAGAARFSPRVALTYKLPDARTTLSASVGAFANRLMLEALGYDQLPARIETLGPQLQAAPLVYARATTGPLQLPRATRWDVEMDRRFDDGVTVRVKYQERHGEDELVVDPAPLTATTGALVLTSTGISRARSLETTIGFRAAGNEIYASYVRASAIGNFNSFDAVEGLFRDPFVQADQIAPLRTDIPNRLLTWGLIRLPKQFTVAPFLEVRDGFPYTAIADDWTFVGPRDGYRLPWFGSLDLYVNKIVGLPMGLPDARVGLKLYNVAAVHSERDVQADIARPDFGATYNPNPRDFSIVFELLWGHH